MSQTGKSRRRRWPYFLIAFLVILIAGGIWLGLAWQAVQAERSNQPTTAKAAKGSISLTVYGSGSIEAGQSISLYAPASALVGQVNVEKGDQVSQGDVLAVLTSDSLTIEISKLEASITSLDLKIRQTRDTAGSASITSPVAGRLMIIYAAAGQPVAAVMDQYNALCVLSADGKMKVEWLGTDVVKPGDPVTIKIDGKSANGLVTRQQNGMSTVEVADDFSEPGVVVTITDQSGQTIGQGELQINKPVYVTADSGIIKTISRKTGDKVSKDSKLFTLEAAGYSADYLRLIDERAQALADLQAARASQADLTVTAPGDGIISQLNLTIKGQIQENQLICVLSVVSSFKMQMQIDELDITSVRVGQTANLKLAATDYQTYPATVSRISAIGTTSGGVTTYPVTIQIQPADGILTGMSASADILVADKKDVLTIPLNALKVEGSRTYVTLVKRGVSGEVSTQDQDVKVGLANGTLAEILSGLAEGDEVQTTSTDAASQNGGAFGMGGLRQMRSGG